MTISRMVIKAFKDEKLTQSAGTYTVRVNPEKYSQSMQVSYNDRPAVGSTNTSLRFSNMPPSKLSFELIFDATGAIPGSAKDLPSEIDRFLKIVYRYQGSIHEPYYLRLIWGELNFAARLTSLDLQYTLFAPSGAPLRARVSVTFANFADPATIASEEDRQSCDLTHVHVVQQGETFVGLMQRTYGDLSQCAKVARLNKLPSMRGIAPGTRLVFPPAK